MDLSAAGDSKPPHMTTLRRSAAGFGGDGVADPKRSLRDLRPRRHLLSDSGSSSGGWIEVGEELDRRRRRRREVLRFRRFKEGLFALVFEIGLREGLLAAVAHCVASNLIIWNVSMLRSISLSRCRKISPSSFDGFLGEGPRRPWVFFDNEKKSLPRSVDR